MIKFGIKGRNRVNQVFVEMKKTIELAKKTDIRSIKIQIAGRLNGHELERILTHTSFFLLFLITLIFWGKTIYTRNEKLVEDSAIHTIPSLTHLAKGVMEGHSNSRNITKNFGKLSKKLS